MPLRALTLLALFAFTTPALAADYVVIDKQSPVAATADDAWAVIGDYCAIKDWFGIASGDGGVGTVRVLNGEIDEVIVGATARSHTYTQTRGSMQAATYHGTVSVAPSADGASAVIRWVGVYDQSVLPDNAAREAALARFSGAYETGIANMKALVEGE